MKGYGTLTQVLGDILRRERNSIEILEKLDNLTVSQNEQVTLLYSNPDGTTSEISVPTFGFLVGEIERLSATVDALAGVDNSGTVSIRLADGTIRNLITTELPNEPNAVENVTIPTTFSIRNNSEIEALQDPIPYSTIDLTGLVPTATESVMLKKIRLDDTTPEQEQIFDQEYLDQNDIDYESLITALADQGIAFTEYESRLQVKQRRIQFTGTFDVQRIFKRTEDVVLSTGTTTETTTVYQLNRSFYNRVTDGAEINLVAGDRLFINYTPTQRTVYEILTINVGTNQVTLRRIEGFDPIRVGTNIFEINPNPEQLIQVDVPMVADQRAVYFFKPVNKDGNLVSRDWGFGIGIFTNQLTEPRSQAPLDEFTLTAIQRLGRNIKSFLGDDFISFRDGVEPEAPVIDTDNLSVEVVNIHKDQINTNKELSQDVAEKDQLNASIQKLDLDIARQKQIISTGDFDSQAEELEARNRLSELNQERSNLVTQFDTLVADLAAKVRASQDFSPKYRIRGFVPLPATPDGTEIIQFIYRYRYLRTDQSSVETPSKTITDANNNSTTAVQSRWIEVFSKTRTRSINQFGELQWESQNLADVDEVNINQIDIPITQGESVELQVKVVTEAGYPNSPRMSQYSESSFIEFPDELAVDTVNRAQIEDDRVRSLFLAELNRIGINDHLLGQRVIGDTLFVHDSSRIATPFTTPENRPIPLNQALTDLRNDLDRLNATVSGERGEIGVSILDDQGNVLREVSNNASVSVFAGYYQQLVENESIRKGTIVTKNYFVEISNLSQADLELLSVVPGLANERIPDDTYTGFVREKDIYDDFRQYWRVPMVLSSVVNDAGLLQHYQDQTQPYIQASGFQSSQRKSQYINSRFRDVSLNTPLYKEPIFGSGSLIPIQTGVNGQAPYVWNYTNSRNGNGFLTDFCVHIDHPDLENGTNFRNKYADLWNGDGIPGSNFDAFEVFYPTFMHSQYFNLASNDPDALVQLSYQRFNKGSSATNFPRKFGFLSNDKFLIGRNTCGAYLYLNPLDGSDIAINSPQFNQGLVVRNGDQFTLRIPISFQSRMTDFSGAGSSGTGDIGGFGSGTLNNLEYRKKIGLDILIANQGFFSFDLTVNMIYRPIVSE